jgi:hypothetical protein
MSTLGVNTNSLNILILNNVIYALILDQHKKIVYSSIKLLTPFDNTQDTDFTDNNLEGQQLYDEIYLMELQENITTIMNQFYEQSTQDIFCESVSISYAIRQLSPNQLKQLEESLMLEIEYQKIDINQHIFHLAKQTTVSRTSFITPRERKTSNTMLPWLIGAIITSMLVGGIIYYIQLQQQKEELKAQEARELQEIKIKRAKLAKIKLPNHKAHNDKITYTLKTILDIIPNSATLNELQLQKSDLTFVCSLKKENIFNKEIKPKLLEIYQTSQILLMQKNKAKSNAIIANNGFKLKLKKPSKDEIVSYNYRKNKFVAKSTLIEQIQAFLPKKTRILFKSKSKSKYLTYNFNIFTIFKEPKDFFNFVDKVNKKSYSIHIKYPIEFAKTKKGLETTFKLEFNQFYKK